MGTVIITVGRSLGEPDELLTTKCLENYLTCSEWRGLVLTTPVPLLFSVHLRDRVPPFLTPNTLKAGRRRRV